MTEAYEPADPKLSDAVIRSRHILIEAIHEHERRDHQGRRCSDERANLVAFLAHSLGINRDEMISVLKSMLFYRVMHDHGGNSDPAKLPEE